jgi:hypothetical protein
VQLIIDIMHGATIVYNPYAKKKPLPEISRKPLQGLSTHAAPAEDTSSLEALSSSVFIPSSRPEDLIRPASLSRATTSSSSEEAIGNPWLVASERLGTPAAAGSTLPVGNSISLPLWQRLPSETISFGSAEILTVPEICQRFRNNSIDGQPGKSIRVTGVLVHRYVHADASISLVLRDPLANLNETRRPSSILKRPRPSSSRSTAAKAQPITPAVRIIAPATTKTPGTTLPLATTTTTGKRPQQSILFNKAKTPVLVYKKQNTERRLSFAAGLKQAPDLLKRPPTVTNPLDVLANSIKGSSCIWIVVANPLTVQLAVNDLVMVIGEVQKCHVPSGGDNCGRQDDGEDSVTLDNTHPSSTAVAEVVETIQRGNTNHCVWYTQARILRNANDTNMMLHTDALMARRMFLKQGRASDTANEDGGP